MNQRNRILFLVVALVLVIIAVLAIEAMRGQLDESDIPPGNIPIYIDGKLMASFGPTDLEELELASFVDTEEGKTQEGWMLLDILPLYVTSHHLKPDSQIIVSSSSREKRADLTWSEVDDPANNLLFDLSGRGTLKLVSTLDRLDVRDEWVQDVDMIEIITP
ncbi:MAG: hypothetical protein JXA42_26435 [Anaerolineales bacterium]|nr:hypothetical protein [Anaerolineales bacterium]